MAVFGARLARLGPCRRRRYRRRAGVPRVRPTGARSRGRRRRPRQGREPQGALAFTAHIDAAGEGGGDGPRCTTERPPRRGASPLSSNASSSGTPSGCAIAPGRRRRARRAPCPRGRRLRAQREGERSGDGESRGGWCPRGLRRYEPTHPPLAAPAPAAGRTTRAAKGERAPAPASRRARHAGRGLLGRPRHVLEHRVRRRAHARRVVRHVQRHVGKLGSPFFSSRYRVGCPGDVFVAELTV